ncbi:hypothetical protein F4803DRAFT_574997 [Xylaria telfairii]|nr:hypothetical protein F4803DRAFT_574997 [Xylaria telfairii]
MMISPDDKDGQDVPDYFGPGHDEAESLFTRKLDSYCVEESVLSFMLCGVGDGRHLFKTILHFTILDHKPAVLARVFIFLSLMPEAGDLDADQCEASTSLLSLAYLFCAHLIPPNVAAEFQSAARRLGSKLQNKQNPFKWVHIQTAPMKLLNDIHQWMGVSKTMHLTAQWSINPTLIDLEWEANKEQQGPPDFEFSPFQIIKSLSSAMNMQETRAKDRDAISCLTSFFNQALQVLHRFQDEVMIGVFVGDAIDILERIRYDRFKRPGLTSPKQYHVIHMSNIPNTRYPATTAPNMSLYTTIISIA